jgi:hypothetical protein
MRETFRVVTRDGITRTIPVKPVFLAQTLAIARERGIGALIFDFTLDTDAAERACAVLRGDPPCPPTESAFNFAGTLE